MKKIPLTHGFEALVDDELYPWLIRFQWYADKSGTTHYAKTNFRTGKGKQKQVRMHRYILGIEDESDIVDHIDCNGLNNQLSNLRLLTRRENLWNVRKKKGNFSSQFKGVHFMRGKWVARIGYENKRIYLGWFNTQEEAAKAYDVASKEYHEEYGRRNF